jgi:protein-tyrosine phosphatase
MPNQGTTPVYDGDSMELPPRVVHLAIKWLMWQHGMTVEEAGAVMARIPRGNTKQRQRQEAIDVADFVEHQGNA